MFEKYDPGFLAAFIGVVMSCTFAVIYQQIIIIYRFSEKLKILEDMVGTDYGVLPSDLVQLLKNANDMVTEGRHVPRFHLKKRYQISNRMAKLIVDIKEKMPVKIVVHPDPASNLAADPQMVVVAHMDAAEGRAAAEEQAMAHTDAVEETGLRQRKMVAHMDAGYISLILLGIWPLIHRWWHTWMQAMAHTDGVEETAAAEEQAMAHTDALEETAAAEEQEGMHTAVGMEIEVVHTDAVEQTTIAEETGLRQRKKIVASHDMKCEKCERRTLNVVAGVKGVDSIAVDMKQKKITVIGEADPVFLIGELRKFGFAELLSVGPANPMPCPYGVVTEEYNPKTCTIC